MFDSLSEKFSSIVSSITGKSHFSEQNLEQVLIQIQETLLESDVSYQVVQDFIDSVKKELIGQKITHSLKPSEMFLKIVHDRMLAFLGGAYLQETYTFQIPSVILLMGLQGSGKTTTAAKLAYFIKKQAEKKDKIRKILCASVDFYRPAAVEQLRIVSQQAGVDFYQAQSLDPIVATNEILKYYKINHYEYLILDTAGRLQIDDTMMAELIAIKRIVQPKYSFLVLDAMTGQQALNVAQVYDQKIGFDSAILSKMDSSARVGAAFSFRYVLKKPIYFIGIGEKVDKFELFKPERVVKRMLGLGDLATLVERAQDTIKQKDQEQLQQSFMSGKITLDDFFKQLQMVSQLGSISSMLRYIPGMGNMKISEQDAQRGEKELKKFKVILSSMTSKERFNPSILSDISRKKRIAQGAGVTLIDVNLLLQRFEQSQQFVKLLKKNRFFEK
ncbi:signal recognition particle protein [Candidatus Babeliales bacterium]|nr:signal recognition particle protein [Candidatus Babeliales bacterium]